VNEVVEVLTRNSKVQKGEQKKLSKNDSFSVNVPGAGIETPKLGNLKKPIKNTNKKTT
jgi:hypothetical protein